MNVELISRSSSGWKFCVLPDHEKGFGLDEFVVDGSDDREATGWGHGRTYSHVGKSCRDIKLIIGWESLSNELLKF